MNGTNKTLFGIAVGISAAYMIISFIFTAKYFFDSGDLASFTVCLMNPVEFFHGNYTDAYVVLSDYSQLNVITENYDKLVSYYWDYLPDVLSESYYMIIFSAIGVLMVIIGCISPMSRNFKGEESDPQEYLFTGRPNSLLRCLVIPWNAYAWCWAYHKVPVIVPIVFTPFILPYALIADVFLLIIFVIEKAAVSVYTRAAFNSDKAMYDKETEYAVCPVCKRNFYQPKVMCKCGLIIDYPVPDCHGFKTHTCNNGHEIPCNNLDGTRGRLKAVCPFCSSKIDTHEAKPLVVSMVGAESAGKTTLLLSAVEDICNTTKAKGITTEIVSTGIVPEHQQLKDRIMPTAQGELDTECFFIRSRDLHEKAILINDISGREFEPDDDKNLFEEYYKYNDGIIFVIDPGEVMSIFNSNSPTKGSKTTPRSTFETFYSMYTTINRYSPSVRSSVPFAVVLTKMDVPRISDAMREAGSPEEFLRAYGQEDFLKIVASTFPTVKYFTASSLGRDTSSAAVPFVWLLSGNDEELATKAF